MGSIPVAGAKNSSAQVGGGVFYTPRHRPTLRRSRRIGFVTLARRFRVGSLAGRDKFPLRVSFLKMFLYLAIFS